MDDTLRRAMLDSNWASIRRRTEAHAESMSTSWSREAYEILMLKVSDFVRQPVPRSDDELHRRFSQSMNLNGIIGSVSHIEMMLGKYSNRNEDRLRLVQAACDLDISGNVFSGTMALTMQVSTICADELTAMSRRRQVRHG